LEDSVEEVATKLGVTKKTGYIGRKIGIKAAMQPLFQIFVGKENLSLVMNKL